MGGCASRPKELDDELRPEPLPSDAPATETIETKEPVAQEENKGGEEQKEAPLVDLSEPKPEGENASSEPKIEAAEAVPAAAEASTVVTKPETDKKVVEVTAVPAPEEQKAEAVAAPVVSEEKAQEPKAKAEQPEAAPAKVEDQKDAPLVKA